VGAGSSQKGFLRFVRAIFIVTSPAKDANPPNGSLGRERELRSNVQTPKAAVLAGFYSGEDIGGVVVIESDSLISARMYALASRLDDGFTFAGGHALDAEQTALVTHHAIGRTLTLAEAERLRRSFEAGKTLTKPKSF
jgi:hypothetical protein